jgi:hypothetical protein
VFDVSMTVLGGLSNWGFLLDAALGTPPPQATTASVGVGEGVGDGVAAGLGSPVTRTNSPEPIPAVAIAAATTPAMIRWRRLRWRSAALRAASLASWRSLLRFDISGERD